jgi:hypothetical protein
MSSTLQHAIESNLLASANATSSMRFVATGENDPILEVTSMVEDLDQTMQQILLINETIPKSVNVAIADLQRQIRTEFDLINKPVLESVASQQGTFKAIVHQLQSLEKRFVNTGHISSTRNWQNWIQLSLLFGILVLLGFNTIANKDVLWLQSDNGKMAKRIANLNPLIAKNCHNLSPADIKKLKIKAGNVQICSVLM